MPNLNAALDQYLLDLSWSLWTELGVAGVKRHHQDCIVDVESLLILTAAIIAQDPRLRDESLDWCSKYHHFVSISRLKFLLKDFSDTLRSDFSIFSTTLNAHSIAKWPVYAECSAMKVKLSQKSILKSMNSPALLNLRARALFGNNARADLLTFFLMHIESDFSASDLVQIGYTKRNLSEVLDEFCVGNLCSKFSLRNQFRYRLEKNDILKNLLGPIPSKDPSWNMLISVLLTIRECLISTKDNTTTTQVVAIRNLLISQSNQLQRLHLTPPEWSNNFQEYYNAFSNWLIDLVKRLSKGS